MDLASQPVFLGILFFIVGAVFGSFGNVLCTRLPVGETLFGRSYCEGCKRSLHPLELVPVASFLLLRGRCRTCKISIPLLFTLVELCSGLLFLLALAWAAPNIVAATFLGIALWLMLVITLIDMTTQMIPDVLTGVLIVAVLLLHWSQGVPLLLSGALLGVVFFGGQWLVSRGTWVGSGDIFLVIALGLLVGDWRHMLLLLMVAYIVGALVVSVLLLSGRAQVKQQVAFGPFLILGAIAVLLFGTQLLNLFVPVWNL
jgi:prepilin signal peptidase PulO-like enzyme (type II secretory pathway)